MNTQNLKKTIKHIINANKETGLNLIPCIWGKTGIGKTEVTKQILKELGYEMAYVTPGNMEDVGDLVGLPTIQEDGQMHYATPDWFPTKPKTIIFLDEINRCKPQIRQALFPLLNQKRIFNNILPEDCHFIAAGNPPTDEYETVHIVDHAFLSRFVHIEFLPTPAEWRKFTVADQGDQTFVNFLMDNTKYIEPKVADFAMLDMVRPDRRKASHYAKFLSTEPAPVVAKAVGYGMLGLELVEQFYANIDDYRPRFNGADLLKKFTKKDKETLLGMQMDTDILNKVLDEVKEEIEKNKKGREKFLPNIVNIYECMPADLVLKSYRELVVLYDNENAQPFSQKVGENKRLIKRFSKQESK